MDELRAVRGHLTVVGAAISWQRATQFRTPKSDFVAQLRNSRRGEVTGTGGVVPKFRDKIKDANLVAVPSVGSRIGGYGGKFF